MTKHKYKPGDRVSFTSVLLDGEESVSEGTVLYVWPEDRDGRIYRVALDSLLWHGIYLSAHEHRLTNLKAVDTRVLAWLRDQELIAELRVFNHREAADRLEDIVGRRYTGEEYGQG